MRIVCRSQQNIMLSVDLLPDVVFQGFYSVRFVSRHALHQVDPQKEIWRSCIWQSRGPQVLWNDSVLQWRNTNMVGTNATQHNLSTPWQITRAHYQHEQAILEHVPSVFIHLFKNYRQNWTRHSTSITLYLHVTGFRWKHNSVLEWNTHP